MYKCKMIFPYRRGALWSRHVREVRLYHVPGYHAPWRPQREPTLYYGITGFGLQRQTYR